MVESLSALYLFIDTAFTTSWFFLSEKGPKLISCTIKEWHLSYSVFDPITATLHFREIDYCIYQTYTMIVRTLPNVYNNCHLVVTSFMAHLRLISPTLPNIVRINISYTHTQTRLCFDGTFELPIYNDSIYAELI